MNFKINTKNTEDRPVKLVVICILSWIYIGFYFVVSAIRLISGRIPAEVIKANETNIKSIVLELRNSGMHSFADLSEKLNHMTFVLNENHYAAVSLTLIGLILGGIGVSLMFLGKKLGFHLYIIYSIFTIAQLYFFFSASEIPNIMAWYEIIVAGSFIALYASTLKWMR